MPLTYKEQDPLHGLNPKLWFTQRQTAWYSTDYLLGEPFKVIDCFPCLDFSPFLAPSYCFLAPMWLYECTMEQQGHWICAYFLEKCLWYLLRKGTATRGRWQMAERRHGEGKEKGKGIESKFLHIALMNSTETPKRGVGHGKCWYTEPDQAIEIYQVASS